MLDIQIISPALLTHTLSQEREWFTVTVRGLSPIREAIKTAILPVRLGGVNYCIGNLEIQPCACLIC